MAEASQQSSHGYDFDLFVIGSGPGGQRAAIQASKLGKRVGLAEEKAAVGGASVNLGTIPSKTLREAVLPFSNGRQGMNSAAGTLQGVTISDLLQRVHQVVANEMNVARHQLLRNNIELLWARASFVNDHALRLDYSDGNSTREVTAEKIVIAVGTRVTEDPHIPFDGRLVFTSDDILNMDRIPRTLAVVGAGVIGVEFASMFAALGVRVTLIDKRDELLPFVDSEIAAALLYHLRRNRVTVRLGEEVQGIERANGAKGERVQIQLASGKRLAAEKALYSIGRTGATDGLGLESAGLTADGRHRIAVNSHYQTAASHIYAVGDVIGFRSLAATSMEQGRIAAAHAFGARTEDLSDLYPFGIYTVPEISMVGRTESELTEAGVPYEIGLAAYREIARGQIIGDLTGLLKLLFHLETRQLLGVHIIGEGATELVHIGQAVMALGGGIDYFVNAVFNYPTLAECYKTAAFDAQNRMAEIEGPSSAERDATEAEPDSPITPIDLRERSG